MPGIVGLITKMPQLEAEAQLARMLDRVRHESFYNTGTWVDEQLGVYVGWTVRKNSFSDSMPLRNELGDVVLIYSGEDFSDPGVAQRLRSHGHEFEVEGPSYLVHLYEDEPSFPASLNGRFHGLLCDRKSKTAMLFNDRYGMHRIYYYESKEAFYFASEAKALLAVRDELRALNLRSLGEFISCGCVLENRTLFEGISVLPPGAAWRFGDGQVCEKRAYFEPQQWENQDLLAPEPYYEQLREVFSRNLPRYFGGQQRIALSLTGGLDTRMILAWHRARPGSLPCYSFCGSFRDCQDVVMARRVARACRQPHQVISVEQEFLSQFPYYAERTVYLTDGCASVSCSADLYVNEVAREIAPVRMTGNYGGEVLRRVRAFKPVHPTAGVFRPELACQVEAAQQTYSRLLQVHPLSFAVFRQAPWHHQALLALEETQLSLRSPYLDNDFVRTVFRAPGSAATNNDVCLQLIADGDPALMRIRTDRGLAGDNGRLVSAVSRHLLEFTFKAEYAYDYGMPQWVARIDHAFAAFHLERLFLGRHKFYHFRAWYRDALAQYVREMLLDSRTLSRPYLQKESVEAIVRGHLKGNRNFTTAIHQILTLELFHRLFLDSKLQVHQQPRSRELVEQRP